VWSEVSSRSCRIFASFSVRSDSGKVRFMTAIDGVDRCRKLDSRNLQTLNTVYRNIHGDGIEFR